MKTYLLLLVLWLGAYLKLSAQNTSYTKLKTENNAVKKIPNNQKYQYVAFKPGSVAYNTGSLSTAALNYNFLLDEMHFINSRGDTLSLDHEYLIKHVIISPDTFFYQAKKGYLQVIATYKPVQLAVKQTIRIMRNEKQAGYDQASAVAAIKEFSFYVDHNGQVKKLQPKGNALLAKENSFFLIDQNRRLLPATKATVLTIFQNIKDEVSAYLKENKINFNQEADLRKLLAYCQGLNS